MMLFASVSSRLGNLHMSSFGLMAKRRLAAQSPVARHAEEWRQRERLGQGHRALRALCCAGGARGRSSGRSDADRPQCGPAGGPSRRGAAGQPAHDRRHAAKPQCHRRRVWARQRLRCARRRGERRGEQRQGGCWRGVWPRVWFGVWSRVWPRRRRRRPDAAVHTLCGGAHGAAGAVPGGGGCAARAAQPADRSEGEHCFRSSHTGHKQDNHVGMCTFCILHCTTKLSISRCAVTQRAGWRERCYQSQ